jgi:sialate O-acetylesterase
MPRRGAWFWAGIGGFVVFWVQAARADVKPHALFTENMVLQQGMKVPVWGTAADGEEVTVEFQGQRISATAKDGKWMVRLDDLKAGGPFPMTISGNNKIEWKNILVGEVWICSGQSNMWWPVSASSHPKETAAESKNAMIRLYTVPMITAPQPQHDLQGKLQWAECGPATVPSFSAVAYHFGRDLEKALQAPVGLIHTSWGGTFAEAWTSRATLEGNPGLKELVPESAVAYLGQLTKAWEQYPNALAKYHVDVDKAKKEGITLVPKKPKAPWETMNNPNVPSVLYNGMIAPLIPYAIRGAIWYQGESNAGRAYQYQALFSAMIQNWRHDWHEGDFPFLFAQLAPFTAIVHQPGDSQWAELRESQRQTSLTLPNTAMAVITDVGDEKDIHPKNKATVGARLALAAEALAYGKKVDYTGPVYDSMKVEGDKIVLSFKNVGGGFVVRGERLTGFTVAGSDHKFHNAHSEVKGDQIVVSCPEVPQPVAVRFGWANYPVVNLWSKDGLPASPFRTDDFPMSTQPRKKRAS